MLTRIQENKIIENILEYGIGRQVPCFFSYDHSWKNITLPFQFIEEFDSLKASQKMSKNWDKSDKLSFRISKWKNLKDEEVIVYKGSYIGKKKDEYGDIYVFVGCGKLKALRIATDIGLTNSKIGKMLSGVSMLGKERDYEITDLGIYK